MISESTMRRIKDALGARGVTVVSEENRGQCLELVLRIGSKPAFAYLFPGRYGRGVFARITDLPMGCLEALTTPAGLYSFQLGDVDELAESIAVKAAAVTRLKPSRRA